MFAVSAYSKAELYELWTYFRDQSNATEMMRDFALCSRKEAEALIREFEIMYEAHTLDGTHRGKAD